MNINISKPIKIKMEVIEIDDILPSMNMSMCIEKKYYNGSVIHRINSIWFQLDVWDEFVDKLMKLSQLTVNKAEMVCMSKKIYLIVEKIEDNEEYHFSVCNKESLKNDGDMLFFYKKYITLDDLSHLQRSFYDFQKWW